MVRVGGHATFAETRRDSDFISIGELRSLVVPHGFELVERRGIGWQYVARFGAA